MDGQVLEVDCDQPAQALRVLRELEDLEELVLYGALVHVVAPKIASRRQEIQDTLQEAGIIVRALDLIAPSLEDVFIASVRQTSHLSQN